MAVSHSVEMAQQGTIWHGSFVSQGNLGALNASSLGENVGMGGDVATINDALMNSPHHLENIMDPAFNQVGIGVIVSGGTVYVTEDFLHSKSPGTARPTPVAHPAVPKASAPHSSSPKVASSPPRRVTGSAPAVSAWSSLRRARRGHGRVDGHARVAAACRRRRRECRRAPSPLGLSRPLSLRAMHEAS